MALIPSHATKYRELHATLSKLSATMSRQIAKPLIQCTQWEFIKPKMLGIATWIMLDIDLGISSMRLRHNIVKEEILKSFKMQDNPIH